MANRYPLVVDSSNFRIEEIPVGDNLDLNGTSLLNASHTGVSTFSGNVLIPYPNQLGVGTASPKGTVHFDTIGSGTTWTHAQNAFVLQPTGNIGIGTTGGRDTLNLTINNIEFPAGVDRYRLSIYGRQESFVCIESGQLVPGTECQYVAVAATSQARIGVLRNSSNTKPCGFVLLSDDNGAAGTLWYDTSGNLRTYSAYPTGAPTQFIGTTGGTVVGTQTSDERLKNVGIGVAGGLEKINQLNPVYYTLKSDPETQKVGFIAQEVLSVVPEAVYSTKERIDDNGNPLPYDPEAAVENPKLAMEYVALIPILVKAVQELSAEVEQLKAAK